jgi:Ca2+-binding RTX toxin-like protein
LFGGPGNDTLYGDDGDDYLSDSEGNNSLIGGAGNDTLVSRSRGSNYLSGGDGDDVLDSGGGDDLLYGGAGNDRITVINRVSGDTSMRTTEIFAGPGADVITVDLSGNAQVTVLASGGEGAERYVLSTVPRAGSLTITDFEVGDGGDILDLSALLRLPTGSGNPFGDSGYLRFQQRGADAVLQVDLDGATGGGGFQDLVTLRDTDARSVTSANFVNGYSPNGAAAGGTRIGTDGNDTITGGADDDDIRGGNGDDVLSGMAGKDQIDGGAGNDILDGGEGDDVLLGGAGNDILNGGNGDDLLVGGAGVDTALYAGVQSRYLVTSAPDGFHVMDLLGGEGTDTLIGVERVMFSDSALALDIDGVAGQAYRLYRAAFDRAPELTGMGYWLKQMDQGATLEQVATSFIASNEFVALYGAAPSNAEIVERMYRNVLHRAPEQAGYEYWVDILNGKKASLASVLVNFSEGGENKAAVAELIGQGISFLPFGG